MLKVGLEVPTLPNTSQPHKLLHWYLHLLPKKPFSRQDTSLMQTLNIWDTTKIPPGVYHWWHYPKFPFACFFIGNHPIYIACLKLRKMLNSELQNIFATWKSHTCLSQSLRENLTTQLSFFERICYHTTLSAKLILIIYSQLNGATKQINRAYIFRQERDLATNLFQDHFMPHKHKHGIICI